jgi:hypothetical protein
VLLGFRADVALTLTSLVALACNTDPPLVSEYPEVPYRTGDLVFSLKTAMTADWLVAQLGVSRAIETTVPISRRILVVTEPQGYFPPDFINQFGIVISPFRIDAHRGIWVQDHGGLPAYFHLDRDARPWRPVYDYRALAELDPPPKRNAISVVVSTKTFLPGHRTRLDFVRRLRGALGDRVEVFGRGIRPVACKADAILPYKYHLVLENALMPSYWTEKVADAYLGYAFPFVSGPPNLDRYFPRESFEPIDVSKPEHAADTIAAFMDAGVFEERLPEIRMARARILDGERLCHVAARAIAANPNAEPRLPSPAVIHTVPKRRTIDRIRREAARLYWQADHFFRAGPRQ